MPSKSSTPVALRFPNTVISQLDALAALRGCGRPEAIRLAVNVGLATLSQSAPQEPGAARRKRRQATTPAAAPEAAPVAEPQSPVGSDVADLAERTWTKSTKGKRKAGPAKTATPEPESMPEAAFDLVTFAAQVLQAAQRTKTGRFGDDRIFISHVWRRFKREQHPKGMDLDAFKARLVKANRERCLSLVCADMAPSLNQADVAESEIRYLSATFHFLCI